MMNKKQPIKLLMGVTLSAAILMSGATMFTAKPAAAAAASSSTASNVIATGERYIGTPYSYGARSGRTDRFDCSSFVQYAFAQNGIKLPRSSRDQAKVGTYVPRSQLRPGDLVFFYSPIHHVAIYIGNGKILQATRSSGVTISSLNSGYWNSHYTTARRVLPAGQAWTAR